MSINKEEVVKNLGSHEKDTGSTSVQVGLLTERISHLTEHLKKHKKDFSTRRSLLKLAGKRRRFLKYLNRTAPEAYSSVIQKLNIRGI